MRKVNFKKFGSYRYALETLQFPTATADQYLDYFCFLLYPSAEAKLFYKYLFYQQYTL
jgi:hypothetical protein